jgi:hypothetical protein
LFAVSLSIFSAVVPLPAAAQPSPRRRRVRGDGCTGGATATCFIGTLAAGTGATVTMVFTARR